MVHLTRSMRRFLLLLSCCFLPTSSQEDEALKQQRDQAWLHSQLDAKECMGPLVAQNVFLREKNATDGAVNLPPRPSDLDCYTRTVWRSTLKAASSPAPGHKYTAVLVNGEVSRLDPSGTFVQHVVAPWTAQGHEVVVFLTLQNRRQKAVAGEWHAERFATLTELDDAGVRRKLESMAQKALAAGASVVQMHVYDLIRRPPLMPSRSSGGPGHSLKYKRFEVAWASYPLHLLVHSKIYADLERFEKGSRRNFDFAIKMRADTAWVGDAPVPSKKAVLIKSCLPWGGLNDKIAIFPLRYGAQWMRLLEQYYDSSLVDYKNSEQFQLILARRHSIPVERLKIPATDYYHWLKSPDSTAGCFAANYARPDCFTPAEWRKVENRVCPPKHQPTR